MVQPPRLLRCSLDAHCLLLLSTLLQSRRAYAEIRPRIKGRFVTPEEYAAYQVRPVCLQICSQLPCALKLRCQHVKALHPCTI